MAKQKKASGRRQWFLRPLWRDPSFIFCVILSVVLYALMLPALLKYATNPVYTALIGAYFFLLFFLVCAIISIPIGTIRGYWRGQEESDERDRDPTKERTKTQAAFRVGGRMLGRSAAAKDAKRTKPADD